MTEHDEVAELIRKLSTWKPLGKEAAWMLEKQRDEIARLRAALKEIVEHHKEQYSLFADDSEFGPESDEAIYHASRRDLLLKALGEK